MKQFSLSIDIDAPPSRVWDVMSDVEHWHEWTESIASITLLNPGPLGPGSRMQIRQPKLPPAEWTVLTVEPQRGFTTESTAPGIRVVARHSIEPTTAGSRVTLSIEYEGLIGALFSRMTSQLNERYLGLEALGLKARSENPGFRHA